jgi:hypothetical protein
MSHCCPLEEHGGVYGEGGKHMATIWGGELGRGRGLHTVLILRLIPTTIAPHILLLLLLLLLLAEHLVEEAERVYAHTEQSEDREEEVEELHDDWDPESRSGVKIGGEAELWFWDSIRMGVRDDADVELS